MLTKREFLGEETWLRWKQDEEALQQFRNQISSKGGKPAPEDLLQMAINKPWLTFYTSSLYDHKKK